MANIWTEFKGLLPDNSISLGLVISINSDGTSTVEFSSGERIRPIGKSVTVGNMALVQGGKIIGETQALTQYNIIIP